LLFDATTPASVGMVTVDGQGFTAGGRVYVAVYDQMGAKLYETRWVNATGPMPPFEAGVWNDQVADTTHYGAIHETFDHLSGANVMIRAYDATTETWSNWVAPNP
jgi:hypothetical protein